MINKQAETAMTAEQLAQLFHETYERLAPQFGYKTREESAKPWADVPKPNKLLMTAVCAEVAAHVREAAQGEIQQLKRDTVDIDMELSSEKDKRYAAERKLAEVEKALRPGTGIVAEIKAACSAWHEEFGVPVSAEYARFLTAIGELTDSAEAALASLRACPLHMTDPIVEKAANGEKCEHCHTPLAVLNGLLVHSITLSRECPTAGNLTGRTKTVASLRAESKPL